MPPPFVCVHMVFLPLLAATALGPAWTGIAAMELPDRPPAYSWSQQIGNYALTCLPCGFLEIDWARVALRDPATGLVRWAHDIDSVDSRQKCRRVSGR